MEIQDAYKDIAIKAGTDPETVKDVIQYVFKFTSDVMKDQNDQHDILFNGLFKFKLKPRFKKNKMKLLVTSYKTTQPIVFDPETMNTEICPCEREAIDRIFLVKEEMKFRNTKRDGSVQEVDVKPGDILIKFYENAFLNNWIVVNSKEWRENLEAYNKRQEEALKENLTECCGCCDCDQSCIPNHA